MLLLGVGVGLLVVVVGLYQVQGVVVYDEFVGFGEVVQCGGELYLFYEEEVVGQYVGYVVY